MSINSTLLPLYARVVDAFRNGVGNELMIRELNDALTYEETGNLSGLRLALHELNSQLNYASTLYVIHLSLVIIAVVAAVSLGVLLWRRRGLIRLAMLRLVMWILLRFRGNDAVTVSGDSDEDANSLIAIIISIIVVLGIFIFITSSVPGWYQFEAIGVMTKSGFSNYVLNSTVGSAEKLYIVVYSHRSLPTWYLVQVQHNGSAIYENERILTYNETWIFPILINFTQPGVYNLTISLYTISTSGSTSYTGRYDRLLINISNPS
ncbi:MAG: hypothetical protein ACP5NY_09320 [Thermocladium sp.]